MRISGPAAPCFGTWSTAFEDLGNFGAECTFVSDDFGVYGDVERAVKQIDSPMAGVIQAAMGLNVRSLSLGCISRSLTIMTGGAFHEHVQPLLAYWD